METWDLFFRFAAISGLILCAAIWIREYRLTLRVILLALFLLAVVAYLLCSAPQGLLLGSPVAPIIFASCRMTAVLFWLAGLSLFDDRFRFGPVQWTVVAAMFLFGTAVHAIAHPAEWPHWRVAAIVFQLCEAALAVHVLWNAYTGLRVDLVEPRRRLRGIFILISGLYVTIVVLVEAAILTQPGARSPQALDLFNVAMICTITYSILFWSLRANILPLIELNDAANKSRNTKNGAVDDVDLDRLVALMESEHVYRKAGLTIAALAERLGLPEYRLRRLINEQLGHRNFNSFLNQYRIAEAAARLNDPADRKTPILTIALDTGFASIGPFNRAFKEKFGITPSNYRQ